mgnify:CR=1 FL=1
MKFNDITTINPAKAARSALRKESIVVDETLGGRRLREELARINEEIDTLSSKGGEAYARAILHREVYEDLANVGAEVFDLDCEILSCQRSKNYDAYNVDAIINNMMVSWMGKTKFELGPCVVIKAKVKDHARHWKYENAVTRLNYVKLYKV